MNVQEEYFLQPGYIYTSSKKAIIKSVLGSCVSVCLWDKTKQIEGMNHYIYPVKGKNKSTAIYGDVAIPYLIQMMINLGSTNNNLIAHVIGGAENAKSSSSIGSENVNIAKKYLKKYDINVLSWDVGGTAGKKIAFNTSTGEALVYKCMNVRESDWY